ncbi:hypothetical protein A9Z61_06015 [Moraxella osloensis]|nr:hypothetical protein [Moraxella osloensis]OBX56949.1 hypothetical protein A9Z61_06015 [Moraxella osloensis]
MTRATIPAITTSPPCAIGEHCGHDAEPLPVIGQSVPATSQAHANHSRQPRDASALMPSLYPDARPCRFGL